MIFETLCPECQKELAAELAQADPEQPLRLLDAYCPHHRVAVWAWVAAGCLAHWTISPVRDEADFRRMSAHTRTLTPEVMRLAVEAAKPAAAH